MLVVADVEDFDSSKVAADIENALDFSKFKMTWTDVAVAVGLSKSSFSHLKNGSEMKFFNLLGVADFLFKNKCLEKFKKWCLSFNQPKNLKYALEYLAVNRQVAELDELIKKIYRVQKDQNLLNTAKGYEILLMYLNKEDSAKVISELRGYEPKSFEMKILSVIIEIWALNRLREYSSMQTLINGLEKSISDVSDEYIRKSFSLQVKEAKSYATLYKFNDIENARKMAHEIIEENFSATFAANASYLLGTSYLFEDYDICLGYMNEYKKFLIDAGREDDIVAVDKYDIPFINNYWNKRHSSLTGIDPSEIAHYEAQNGDKQLAVDIINESIKQEGVSGFKLYYKALATQDDTLFMQSMVYFVSKKGDKFYANLPYRYLKDSVVYKPIADLLMEE